MPLLPGSIRKMTSEPARMIGFFVNSTDGILSCPSSSGLLLKSLALKWRALVSAPISHVHESE